MLICFNIYGIAPIWSSCPCVITNPFTFSWFFNKYVISGITKSTPSISFPGNSNPQSTNIISSSYSKTVIFFPISCNPPNGIIFKLGFLKLNCIISLLVDLLFLVLVFVFLFVVGLFFSTVAFFSPSISFLFWLTLLFFLTEYPFFSLLSVLSFCLVSFCFNSFVIKNFSPSFLNCCFSHYFIYYINNNISVAFAQIFYPKLLNIFPFPP